VEGPKTSSQKGVNGGLTFLFGPKKGRFRWRALTRDWEHKVWRVKRFSPVKFPPRFILPWLKGWLLEQAF